MRTIDGAVHFARVCDYDGRCACGLRIYTNMTTNRWVKVTCEDCLKQKNNKSKNRPDKVAYKVYLKKRGT